MKITATSRRSEREFDISIEGTRPLEYGTSQEPMKFSGWLPLSIIRLSNWSAGEIRRLSDYPDMVKSGDWSGIRDSSNNSHWCMFAVASRPYLQVEVPTKKPDTVSMNNTITAADINAAILNGSMDDHLEMFRDVISRRKDRKGEHKFYDIRIGDEVRFNSTTNPTYLRGAKGKLVEKLNKNVVVLLDHPVGRFSGWIRTSPNLIEKVGVSS